MSKTSISIKVDREVKEKAQKLAQDLGMPLSTIINNYLNHFVQTKEVYFYLKSERLDRLSKEAKEGKNVSPTFDNAKDAIDYLNS